MEGAWEQRLCDGRQEGDSAVLLSTSGSWDVAGSLGQPEPGPADHPHLSLLVLRHQSHWVLGGQFLIFMSHNFSELTPYNWPLQVFWVPGTENIRKWCWYQTPRSSAPVRKPKGVSEATSFFREGRPACVSLQWLHQHEVLSNLTEAQMVGTEMTSGLPREPSSRLQMSDRGASPLEKC